MYYTIQAVNNKGTDQTVRMHRLICAFVVRIWHKTYFRMTWPIWPFKIIYQVSSKVNQAFGANADEKPPGNLQAEHHGHKQATVKDQTISVLRF